MIIEELTLRHWRGYREPHRFRFAAGLNLLVGRNEAGKSTLFEALACLIFDSHSGRRRDLMAMQPLGSSLSPEAELVFSAGTQRYKVAKRFLDHPQSQLCVERGGTWVLEHDGDRADEQLRAILGGQRSGRTLRPEHRGLAQALWYLQLDEPLPAEAWGDAVRQGLAGLVSTVSASPAEQRLLELVERAYAEFHTPKGREKTGSELAQSREDIASLEGELAQLREKAAAVSELRAELEDLAVRREAKAQELAHRQAQLPDLEARLETAATREKELASGESRREACLREAQKHAAVRDRVHHRIQSRRDTEVQVAELNSRTEARRDQQSLRRAEEARERHEWKEVLEPALKQVEAELATFHELERLHVLRRDANRLTEQSQEQTELARQFTEQDLALAEFLAPSDKEWQSFTALQRELAEAQAKRQVAAISVTFQPDDPKMHITAEPDAESTAAAAGKEFLISRPTTFIISGFGRIGVRGGGESLAELDEKVRQLEHRVGETLLRYAAHDAQELSDRHQERHDRERTKAEYQQRLHAAERREPQVEERLAEARGDLNRMERQLEGVSAQQRGWDIVRLREEQSRSAQRKTDLIARIEQAQNLEQTARSTAADLEQELQGIGESVTALRSQMKGWERENADDLEPYGDLDQLERRADAAQRELEQTEQEVAAHHAEYREQVESPRLLHQQTLKALQELDRQVSELDKQVVDRRARIETSATEGFYTRQADVEADLEIKRQRRSDLERRAAAAKLLRELAHAHRQERSSALTSPVGRLLNPWVATLTGGTYDRTELSGHLLPQALHSTRHDVDLPVDSLSYGTHEQIVVLLRLTLGWLLSQEERQLVVLDDPLVNADPVRMQRLNLILQEAAQRMQIILATCNDTPYAGLEGTFINVPNDGRISIDR